MKTKNIKQSIYLISFFALIITVNAAFSQANSAFVVTHDKVTIYTNPKKGANSFIKWGVFPVENKEIRRITMNVTLAYPEGVPNV